ncbi:hypothetical protein TL16_g12518 [Triparma laevis f. inornata]|uniref:Kinesin motor domain-containing protein n=2 Tax=Triparma laevis TaxID=1534972 RepID=A0A9W7C8I8_9STRA|nr:hypothetical protein TL16_g12518 [Triparma laevis f. inornata]GMI05237.1 hypothetical protein TrLO_g13158 [Triparma laevis f. longispina]
MSASSSPPITAMPVPSVPPPVSSGPTPESIRVLVRLRPAPTSSCHVSSPPNPILSIAKQQFAFDSIFEPNVSTRECYDGEIKGVVSQALEGYNSCVLCYGQTGSGKTHTVMGSIVEGREEDGVLGLAATDVFKSLEDKKLEVESNEENSTLPGKEQTGDGETEFFSSCRSSEIETTQTETDVAEQPITEFSYTVSITFLEVYGEEVRDLLHKERSSIQLRDVFEPKLNGSGSQMEATGEVSLVGCTDREVKTTSDCIKGAVEGMERRATGSTNMNLHSSRSHAVFQIYVTQNTTVTGATILATTKKEKTVTTTTSKITFVDLAGSERQKKSGASGSRLAEGININKGLLVLGNVISSLSEIGRGEGSTNIHVPFRESKLTRILRSSLSGNSRTIFVACCSPDVRDVDETICCLRYADRAKSIKVHAKKNVQNNDEGRSARRRLIRLVKIFIGDFGKQPSGLDKDEVDALKEANEEEIEGTEWFAGANAGPKRAKPKARRRDEAVPLEEVERLEHLVRTYRNEISDVNEQLYSCKAELEYAKMTVLRSDGDDFLQSVELKGKIEEYERTVGLLKEQLKELRGQRGIKNEVEYETLELSAVAKMYFTDSDDSDDEESEDFKSFTLRENTMTSHLNDINDTITAKEELMGQLMGSRRKFEAMRGFYENKLVEMGKKLSEDEKEKETLKKEIEKISKEGKGGNLKTLQKQLAEKEHQISRLRNQKKELQNLTRVEARNEKHVARLKAEVDSMKREKVNLTKRIDDERRNGRLALEKARKDGDKIKREGYRWKQEAGRQRVIADNAKKMSKLRLEDANRTRSKYREAERVLRMQTLKRGVMKRAGLDGILLGRRSMSVSGPGSGVNHEELRRWLGGRLEDVSKKEAAADKLAMEWEERMELIEALDAETILDKREVLEKALAKKEGRIRQLSKMLGKGMLGEAKDTGQKDRGKRDVSFLTSREFKALHADKQVTVETAETAMKTLFGMVVRERRRVASLAKSISMFEARAVKAERDINMEKDVVDETRCRAELEKSEAARDHEQNLTSLMMMVSEAHEGSNPNDDSDNGDVSPQSSRMAIMEERVKVLKERVEAGNKEREELKAYKMMERALNSALQEKNKECDKVTEERDELKRALRREKQANKEKEITIKREREMMSLTLMDAGVNKQRPQREPPAPPPPQHLQQGRRNSNPGASPSEMQAAAAAARKVKQQHNAGRRLTTKDFASPPSGFGDLSRIGGVAPNSDDSDDEEMPDWANDIMSDLALIAEGVVPESLLNSSEPPGNQTINDENNLMIDADLANAKGGVVGVGRKKDSRGVFQRLMSPSQATGIHKHRNSKTDRMQPPQMPPPPPPPLQAGGEDPTLRRSPVSTELDAVKAASAVVHGQKGEELGGAKRRAGNASIPIAQELGIDAVF